MESLLNKVCTLKKYIESLTIETPINLTVKTSNGTVYNQISIKVENYGYGDAYYLSFDDTYVAYKYNSNYYDTGTAHFSFTVIGGEDVNNPDVIQIMQSMCSFIMCAPNDSSESLDNKSIEFNMMTLTKFPQISDSIDGIFRIRYCSYYDSYEDMYYYSTLTANCIDFTNAADFGGKLYFRGTSDTGISIYYDFASGRWYDAWDCQLVKEPIFEDFKYTGLENNEEFMSWLTANAKISLKKSKNTRVSNVNGCDLIISYDFGNDYALPAMPISAPVNHNSAFSIINDLYMVSRIEVFGQFLEIYTYRDKPIAGEDVDYVQAHGIITIAPGGSASLVEDEYNSGTQRIEILDLPLIITNFNCSELSTNPEFIQWLADANVKVIPESIENAIIEFASDMDVCPMEVGDYVGKNFLVSYKLNGKQESYISNTLRFMPGDNIGDVAGILIGTLENYCLMYSYDDYSWHHPNSNEIPEAVTISYFYIPELNENPEFKQWIYANSEDVYFAKGINTVSELLTDISDSCRILEGHSDKIYAQDVSHKILNSLGRHVNYYEGNVTLISGGES